MRIGLLAPPWIPVPPPAYGGIERVVALQAAGLAAAGHDVTLVAAPGSAIRGVRVVSPLEALPAQIGMATDEWRHVLGGLDALADVDTVIDHSGPLGALLSAQGPVPALHVVHGSLDGELLGLYNGLVARAPQLRLVAISRSQRQAAPHLPFAGVCYNAVDVKEVPFRASSEGYLAFLGRLAPEKGPAEAIALARDAGLPLLIAAKCREPAEQAYFQREVAPHLGPDVVFLGELDRGATYDFLSRAAALLFPISWREPFGIVLLEAMACGTPVLATNRGAVSEIVRDGVTGFVRNTTAELASVIGRIGEIDRAACRSHVAEHFSSAALVRSYAKLLVPTHDVRVPTPAAPMVFSAPTPLIRPLLARQDLPRVPAAFTADRAAG
ncbi:MAG: glycosyltransferase [Pseudonocardiales bacterium]|nr:glycosyltransferase [Actinomycetota bacterium]PZS21593.1 MAG: glycosyltransferase [Pseudonocardiales bacterium]